MSEKRGQGAIEYLLLLAAAIIVVAVVISFMGNTISETKKVGQTQSNEFFCVTLNAATDNCKCYRAAYHEGTEVTVSDCCSSTGVNPSDEMKIIIGCP